MMSCSHRRSISRSHSRIYRSRTDKVFAGVCGGLGHHFNLSTNWVRAGFVVGFILMHPLAIVLYVVCAFIMPPTPALSEAFHPGAPRADRIKTKKVPPRESLQQIDFQMDEIETKIRALEDHVTSKEYILKRKFETL